MANLFTCPSCNYVHEELDVHLVADKCPRCHAWINGQAYKSVEVLKPEGANVEGKLEARHIDAWPHFLEAMAKVMIFGGSKPGREVNGWTKVGVSKQKCLDAEARHRLLIAKGEKLDKESGFPHLWHRAANLLMLIESELNEKILP